MIDYNNKVFKPSNLSANSETTIETVFVYKQTSKLLSSEYAGGNIIYGHLIGLVDEAGNIDMRYHQLNTNGQLMTGICKSTPEIRPDGKIRLHESWQWTSGDKSKGNSILEEQ